MAKIILTRKLIFSLQTKNGGFTRATTDALGVPYPPRRDWIKKINGTSISEENLQLAKAGMTVYRGKNKKRTAHLFFIPEKQTGVVDVPKLHTIGSGVDVVLYTDGGCWPNDGTGTGGWAYVLDITGQRFEGSGAAQPTTNNRMELSAILFGLQAIKEPARVEVVSDSQYALNTLTTWMHKWKPQKWAVAKNVDLISALMVEWKRHLSIKGTWVRGHTGHPENERCDELASKAAGRCEPEKTCDCGQCYDCIGHDAWVEGELERSNEADNNL